MDLVLPLKSIRTFAGLLDKTYFNYKTTSVLHNYYNPAIVYYNICNLIKLIFESQRVMTKR